MNLEHVTYQPTDVIPERLKDLVLDQGLDICKLCGNAEAELEKPCVRYEKTEDKVTVFLTPYSINQEKLILEHFKKHYPEKELYRTVTLEEFEELNENEINAIFAESGADRELDFDSESATEDLFNAGNYYHGHHSYPQLVYVTKEEK